MVRRKVNAEKFEKPFEYHIPESAVKTSGITWFPSRCGIVWVETVKIR